MNKSLMPEKLKESTNETDRFAWYRHIPNALKTDEEFQEYCEYMEKRGLPKPLRHTKCRPISEKIYNPDLLKKNIYTK